MEVPPRVGLALRRAFDRSVHAAAQALYLLPSAKPVRHGVHVVRDVPYKPTGLRDHLLDIYLPDDGVGGPGELRPAVVYVHGGAF